MSDQRTTRRDFVRQATAGVGAAACFHIVPRHVLGGPAHTPPSERVTRAVIGLGRGSGFTIPNREGDAPVTLAVCDVDKGRMQGALKKAGKPCQGYTDFRHIMDRTDVDVVYIMTPPHWHALISIAAAESGKDIYCEKPMTRFIAEGQAVADAVRRYGRIFQIGTFSRFGASRSSSSKLVRKIMGSGFIGPDKAPTIVLRRNWKVKQWSGRINQPPEPVPANLDWNLYVGPAPMKPYFRHRTHGSFRGYWDYDGGGLADMGQHYIDGIQWTLNKDHTSPVKVRAHALWPQHPDAVCMWGWIELKYEDGTTLVFDTTEWGDPYPGKAKGYPSLRDLTKEQQKVVQNLPDEEPLIGNHQSGFEQAVKLRKPCGGNADAGNRGATLLHLANIAIRTGRELSYDPVKQEFPGDDEANALVNVPMRAPWHL